MDQRKLPEKSLISDSPSGLLRLLRKKFSNLSNPKGGSETLISDPPSGLLRLLNFFLSNLSNPEGELEIRDFSGSFL